MYLKAELYERIKTDESIFEFIQEGSFDGLWYWDLENPENEWMNDRFWTVLGYNPDEMPHKSSAWKSIINQEDLKVATENFVKHCENPNHPYDQIVRYTHKDGSTKWIRCRGLAIRDANGKPIRMLGAHQDISGIKNSETALLNAKKTAEENEEKYRALYNNAPLPYQSLDENGCFIDINPMWTKTLGYERDEVIGKWFGDFLHPDDIEHFRVNFPAFKMRGFISDIQFKLRRKDNTYIDVSFEGSVGYTPEGNFKQTYCVFKDITKQKALENALIAAKEKAEENEKLFKSVIENAPDGVVIIDDQGRFKYISPNAERLFGYDTDEALGHSGDAYTHPDDLPMVLKTMERILADPSQKPKLEYRFKSKTGEYRWIETTFTNLLSDKVINGIVLNFSDITEKKKIFEELLIAKENAERNEIELIKAQEIAHLGSWYLNVETNEVVWTEELYKMYGFDPTLPPPPYTEHKKLFTPESWDILSSSLAKTREFGIPYELELKTIKSDQSNGWMWVRGEAVFDENEKISGLWGAAQDITERKEVEEALRKSQKDYQNLVENTPDIIYSMNREGYFTFVSNNVSRYGFVPEDMMSHHIQEYIHPDDVEVVLGDLQKSFHQETPLKSVFRLAGIEGATLWFEDTSRKLIENDQIIGFTGIIREVTKRKEAEEALLKSNQRLESLLDISRKITSTIDQEVIMQMVVDNAVKLMNLDTGAIYIKSDEEIIYLSATTPALPDRFPGELRKAYLKNHPHLQKAMQTGNYVLMEDASTTKLTPEEKIVVDQRQLRTVLYHPIQIRERSHGVLILSSTETTRVFAEDELEMLQAFANQAAHIIDNVHNYADLKKYTHELEKEIQQREQAEKELIVAKDQAEESDRLKSAFLANMSHEIRTPMNGILGFADLLKEPNLTGDQQQKYIGIIEKSGVRMLNIIDQIVDISKIEAGLMTSDIKETNINEQIEYIYTFFRPEAEAKGINLSYNNTLTNNAATIHTDREKVYAILTNLVKNAIKYTKKGTIELGYVLVDTTKAIEPIGLSSETGQHGKEAEAIPSSELQFYVKDTGIGIPKNRQEAIFERFIQADIEDRMAYQGAGLGLAITKAYVEMLDGKVWVESIEGEGSTFYFTLPYNTKSIKKVGEKSGFSSEPYNEIRKLKILIAEDEEISQMLIDNYIKNFGKEILKARTGQEAVEISRANPDIDLILMDIRMPYMDGYEATKQIRTFNKDVIIIAQTAYGLTGDREKAIKSGCNDYIAKPIKRKSLQALIQKCFEK